MGYCYWKHCYGEDTQSVLAIVQADFQSIILECKDL